MNDAGRRIYLAGLIATWGERDVRYSAARCRLSKEQLACVMAWRRSEARELSEPERGLALSVIRDWRPT